MAEIITDVRLLNVNLHNDYKHTIFFNDRSEQSSYFMSIKNYKDLIDYSYQRKDSKLRVNLSFDEALKYNYVMYTNTYLLENKTYYAFITDYEWNNDNCTTLTLQTDVMQTYLLGYEYDYLPSFVEREHTNDDTVGVNTIPENLEMGEYIVKNVKKVGELQDCYIIVATTKPPDDYYGEDMEALAKVYGVGGNYNGIYSGLAYYRFGTSSADIIILNAFLSAFNDSSAVKCMFLYPKALIESKEEFVLKSNDPASIDFELDKSVALIYENTSTEYKPKNNKLLTYPYVYLMVSNNNGGSAIYQYEHFSSSTMSFKVESALTPGGSIRLIPRSYKGISENNEEGLNLGKYPICNWTSDEFTNWLTQNSVNIGLNLVSGLGQIIAGGAIAVGSGGLGTAVGGSQIVGGISTITNQLAQIHQMSFTPPQSNGNINCGDVITSSKENTFTFHSMTIKPEYMRIIDDYFTAYGYKTNRVKLPEWLHRERWWYTKTIDINLYNYGSIPTADLNKIKDCFNNGITFWRKASDIGHYEYSNNIV